MTASSVAAVRAGRHSVLEDIAALTTGAFLMSWGLTLLQEIGGVTGGLAGVAFLGWNLTGVPLGAIYFVINLPFYYFAVRRLGWLFTIKTFLTVSAISLFTQMQPAMLDLSAVQPLYACVFAGLAFGLGMVIVFRHGASAGGFGIVASYAQERFRIRAGYLQGILDLAVVLGAIAFVAPLTLAYSVIGVVVLNLVLAMNHRPGRYRP
jgi:uncharacterized membrane-anchored protein YitT (DUF2179 family)